jgi:UDP-glucose 4-epimerase
LKILITGGSGFIGRNLAEQLGEKHSVAAPGRRELDLLDAGAVREFVGRGGFDIVIHAAGERANRLLGCGPETLERNCRMFFNLARNAPAFGRMFFLSSGAVYDRAQPMHRISEDAYDAHVPAEPYGFSKYVCAQAIDAMDKVYELRLFGVFGPHEDWRVRFISNACCRAAWDMPVVIRRNVFFDYLDVADLGGVLERLLGKDLSYRHYNVCTGRPWDLKTLAAKVVAASGKPLEILVRNSGLGNEYSGDNTRLAGEIPDFRFRDMDDSITRLYRWLQERKLSIDPELLRFDE